MITPDGRTEVEFEIQQMQFTGLDTRRPVPGLDYADSPAYGREANRPPPPPPPPLPPPRPLPPPSLLSRLIDRIIGLRLPLR